jgi:hypothetical protein
VRIHNGRDRPIGSGRVSFSALDQDGTFLGTYETVVSLAPGETKTVAAEDIDLTPFSAVPATVRVTVRSGRTTRGFPLLTVTNVHLEPTLRGVTVQGNISSWAPTSALESISCVMRERLSAVAVGTVELDAVAVQPFSLVVLEAATSPPRTAACAAS